MNNNNSAHIPRTKPPKMVSEHMVKVSQSKINKKLKRTKKKLERLYPEYKHLNTTQTNKARLSKLIDTISKIEYKYICYLKNKKYD